MFIMVLECCVKVRIETQYYNKQKEHCGSRECFLHDRLNRFSEIGELPGSMQSLQ